MSYFHALKRHKARGLKIIQGKAYTHDKLDTYHGNLSKMAWAKRKPWH